LLFGKGKLCISAVVYSSIKQTSFLLLSVSSCLWIRAGSCSVAVKKCWFLLEI
jgi:hypothetical protein